MSNRHARMIQLVDGFVSSTSHRDPTPPEQCERGEVSQIPTTFPSYVMGSQTMAERLHLAYQPGFLATICPPHPLPSSRARMLLICICRPSSARTTCGPSGGNPSSSS